MHVATVGKLRDLRTGAGLDRVETARNRSGLGVGMNGPASRSDYVRAVCDVRRSCFWSDLTHGKASFSRERSQPLSHSLEPRAHTVLTGGGLRRCSSSCTRWRVHSKITQSGIGVWNQSKTARSNRPGRRAREMSKIHDLVAQCQPRSISLQMGEYCSLNPNQHREYQFSGMRGGKATYDTPRTFGSGARSRINS
jgi:hypothetical protein